MNKMDSAGDFNEFFLQNEATAEILKALMDPISEGGMRERFIFSLPLLKGHLPEAMRASNVDEVWYLLYKACGVDVNHYPTKATHTLSFGSLFAAPHLFESILNTVDIMEALMAPIPGERLRGLFQQALFPAYQRRFGDEMRTSATHEHWWGLYTTCGVDDYPVEAVQRYISCCSESQFASASAVFDGTDTVTAKLLAEQAPMGGPQNNETHDGFDLSIFHLPEFDADSFDY